ncbi:hypothetical protein MYCTH_2114599 [Thermothelomyces thermophilus ATCC 42464]|uniref:MARVEL domain-containing protein n=1 Tax=Thermothelomyces thermophilus (strain ATCC 42464 / BCRC 31852 / DSM 1799) TaxID=573729 RepID=G2Q4J8_THET4|nr:uncharacterized protein MYCTH_2114599 [Thermothelomyces thermophilus ATCC 42464]AEO53691.1 hypothetical protein MYCTH_2114599 [Thermothelomyces thermophilus ATCC 42464]
MQYVAHDTFSLRPKGIYAYAFLVCRIAQIICLAISAGLSGNLLSITSRGHQTAPANLIVVIILTGIALVWVLVSSTGYSTRYLPYPKTLSLDLLFLIPFVTMAAILGLPMAEANCAVVARNGRFEITAPHGSSVGKVSFPSDGRASCTKLFAVWVLLVVISALFTISALSVGFLHLGKKQSEKENFPGRIEPGEGSNRAGYAQGMSEPHGGRFNPASSAQPGGFEAGGNYSSIRPSVSEDRLDLNRPVTVAPDGPAYAGTGGDGWIRAELAGMGQAKTSSADGRLRREQIYSGETKSSTASKHSAMPFASLRSQATSFGKAPTGNRFASGDEAVEGKTNILPGSYYQDESRRSDSERQLSDAEPVALRSRLADLEDVPGVPLNGYGLPRCLRASLIPKPSALGDNGKSGRKRMNEKSAESGWWGALASVIFEPQAEYNRSNVL